MSASQPHFFDGLAEGLKIIVKGRLAAGNDHAIQERGPFFKKTEKNVPKAGDSTADRRSVPDYDNTGSGSCSRR